MFEKIIKRIYLSDCVSNKSITIVKTHVEQKLAEFAVRTEEELEMDLEKQEKSDELAARVRGYVTIAFRLHIIYIMIQLSADSTSC